MFQIHVLRKQFQRDLSAENLRVFRRTSAAFHDSIIFW